VAEFWLQLVKRSAAKLDQRWFLLEQHPKLKRLPRLMAYLMMMLMEKQMQYLTSMAPQAEHLMNHFRRRLFGRSNKELAKLKQQKLLDGANKPLLALDLLDEQHLTPFYGIDFA
jgi:hypothetical protein